MAKVVFSFDDKSAKKLKNKKNILGHSDIATTQIYTHVLDDKKKLLVLKNHPLAKINLN